jgi:hypothetical protein
MHIKNTISIERNIIPEKKYPNEDKNIAITVEIVV